MAQDRLPRRALHFGLGLLGQIEPSLAHNRVVLVRSRLTRDADARAHLRGAVVRAASASLIRALRRSWRSPS